MADKKEKKGKSNILVIVLIAVIVVLIAAFAAYYFIFSKGSKSNNNNSNNSAQTVQTTSQANEATVSLDESIINLADTDAQRYAKVIVSFGYDSSNSKLNAELTSTDDDKKPILSDAVIGILRNKKSTDFTGQGLEAIKQQILNTVNPYLKNGKIDHVYFKELVIQ
ncbi:MAG: flagellar basal body-associated FliL family protein [Clostridium sp.]|nr:flagellar basal body-associated FliL family protein [Clostridium sp.]